MDVLSRSSLGRSRRGEAIAFDMCWWRGFRLVLLGTLVFDACLS